MNDPYGALLDPDFRLSGAPDGPLAGTHFAVKDLYDVAGRVTGAGNPDWRRTHPPASATAAVVTALLDAGAGLAGIAHTDELAFSLNGCNHHYGTPINPAAPDLIPGGSSSGSAVAVAGGLVDFALGTDTGGSVRVPASHCGIFGIRTSHGRISKHGLVPLAESLDSIGWFARTPDLLAAVGEVLLPADPDPLPAFGGLVVAEDCLAEADPQVTAAFAEVLAVLAAAFGPIGATSILPVPLVEAFEATRLISVDEAKHTHRDWIAAEKPVFGPGVAERFAAALRQPDEIVPPARALRRRIADHLAATLADGRIALLPTVPAPPPRRDAETTVLEAYRFRAQRLTCPAGLAGAPQISVPAMRIDGAPIALGLLGAPGSDRMLLAVAARVAAALSLHARQRAFI
jgi:amidase